MCSGKGQRRGIWRLGWWLRGKWTAVEHVSCMALAP